MKNTSNLFDIASQFKITGVIESIHEYGDGHINDSFLIKTKEPYDPDYILQRKNKHVFHPVPDMMNNIFKVTNHLKKKIKAKGGDPFRESMTIFPSNTGEYYYIDQEGEYWAICEYIKDHVIYQQADSPELAYKGGRGIGEFQYMLFDLKEPLADILPGYHNMRYRFKQWDNVLEADPLRRKNRLKKEISWIQSRRLEMLSLWELIENHTIITRVAHNDTKINNILFDTSGNVLCLIDLDTVMNSSVLNDFGDAIRTYTNTGLEDDPDLANVSMNLEIYKAFAQGYIEETISFLTPYELSWLSFSAKYITFEQVLRFLMDYIDGDHYYKIKFTDHNLVRTYAQYQLLRSMEEQFDVMNQWVNRLAGK